MKFGEEYCFVENNIFKFYHHIREIIQSFLVLDCHLAKYRSTLFDSVEVDPVSYFRYLQAKSLTLLLYAFSFKDRVDEFEAIHSGLDDKATTSWIMLLSSSS